MSERSSRRSWLAFAVLAAACGPACGKTATKPKPTADPDKVRALAVAMDKNMPTPGAVPPCKTDQLGGATMTFRTVEQLAGITMPKDPEHATWINPPQMDVPAARALADGATGDAAREAAGELLSAPFYTVYRVDMVNAPIALGLKELKIGTIGLRIIRYDKAGNAVCVLPFYFQNDKAKSDWAISQSDKVIIDPAVAKAMRDDLVEQYLKLVPRNVVPPSGTR